MKKKLNILTLGLCFLWLGSVQAQQTGSFNTQVSFMSQSRTLSCYVPTNYNSSNKYRLVVGLHGLGDNSTNYRNALINTLHWQRNFPNTIFIFPDGGNDANHDFYTPAGDEGIINEAMDYAMQNYHIDTNYVVLQGFSLGGRSAAKFGLDNPQLFKGLLLNTPAFQGKQDASNVPPASLNFNYSNASQIPIYITVGDQDLYFYILNPLVKNLKKQDAKLRYVTVAGMGHTLPDSARTSPAFPFFEDPTQLNFDLDLFDIDLPQHSCSSNISPSCFIQNKGDTAITSVVINYQFAGNSGSTTWTGNLGPYQHAQINLPALSTSNGKQALDLSIGNINGSHSDTVMANNQLSDTVQVDLQSTPLAVSEGFEGSSPGWVFNETGTLFEWYTDTGVKKSGQASIGNFNTILLFYTKGNVESFESPELDLSSASDARLTFDVAYNYHKYTPPYFVKDTIFADTLEIAISTDCGQSWHSLYKKAGAALATAANPIINALSISQAFFNPTAGEWRRDSVDLGAYDNSTGAILRFNYISDNGGSINIDNIMVNGQGLSLNEIPQRSFEIYPNPAKDHFTLSSAQKMKAISVYDAAGNMVFHQKITEFSTGKVTVDFGRLPTGMYEVKVESAEGASFQKLLINP